MERSLAGAIPAQDQPTPLPSVMSFENDRQSAILVKEFSALLESQEWTSEVAICGSTLKVFSRNGRHQMAIQENELLVSNTRNVGGACVWIQMQSECIQKYVKGRWLYVQR